MEGTDWNAPSAANVERLTGYMLGSKPVLVSMVVKNNPVPFYKYFGKRPGSAQGPIVGLILAMDQEEQDELLNSVEYVPGQDMLLDAVYSRMMETMREAGGEGLDQLDGPSKFIGLAISGLFGVANAYAGIKAGKEAEQAEWAAARAQYEAEQNAKLQADANARARKEKLKKWAPYGIAALVLILLLLYRQYR